MGKFQSDTISEFLGKMIQHLMESHDPSEDGESTGQVVSIYQQLKDLVRDDIPYTYKRAYYIAERLVAIAPDHGETYDPDEIRELAEEVNSWNS